MQSKWESAPGGLRQALGIAKCQRAWALAALLRARCSSVPAFSLCKLRRRGEQHQLRYIRPGPSFAEAMEERASTHHVSAGLAMEDCQLLMQKYSKVGAGGTGALPDVRHRHKGCGRRPHVTACRRLKVCGQPYGTPIGIGSSGRCLGFRLGRETRFPAGTNHACSS